MDSPSTSSFAWNKSEQINLPSLQGATGLVQLFPTEGLGSPLSDAPPFQGNIRARYEMPIASYNWYAQVGAQHVDHSYADVVTQGVDGPPNFELAPYTTYDAALGVSKNAWLAEFFGQNLSDTRAQLFISSAQFVQLTTVNRPRVLGLRFSYKFGGANN